MRPTLPRPTRRRRPADQGAPRLAKGSRSTPPSSGGPVAPTAEYVGRRGRRVAGAARAARSGSSNVLFPRRRSPAVVRRSVFALLLCASIVLISLTYRGGVALHGAQMAVLEVVAPIERGLGRAWDPIAGAWNWSGRLITAANENPKLKAENEELREAVRLAQDQEAELSRLRRDLNYDETFIFPAGFRNSNVHARVQVRAAGVADRTLTIDRGSDDGIAVDDSVMVTGGLLGRVIETTDSTAVVGLITDDQQSVSASVTGSDAWGVLETISTEGTPVMKLDQVKQSAKVAKGDLVVTSGFSVRGLSSIYPKGVPIGTVTSVGNDPADLQKTVQVKPFADFDRIDEVLVLVPDNRGGGA